MARGTAEPCPFKLPDLRLGADSPTYLFLAVTYVNRSCQTCHHFPEQELKARVEDIQDNFFNLRNTALDALVDLINDIKAEKAKGASDAQLAPACDYQRKGQFMIDFVMSENSMGFHAPQEATRILGDAINLCRLGQLSLHGGPPPSHNPPNIENVSPSPGPAAAPTKQSSRRKQLPTVAQVRNP